MTETMMALLSGGMLVSGLGLTGLGMFLYLQGERTPLFKASLIVSGLALIATAATLLGHAELARSG